MHLPMAALSADQSDRWPGFLGFRLTGAATWLWGWLPHGLPTRRSLAAVLFRTPITQMIFFNLGIIMVINNFTWSIITVLSIHMLLSMALIDHNHHLLHKNKIILSYRTLTWIVVLRRKSWAKSFALPLEHAKRVSCHFPWEVIMTNETNNSDKQMQKEQSSWWWINMAMGLN